MIEQSKINKEQSEVNNKTDISLKELFERVVRLETKFDESISKQRKDIRYFRIAAWIIVLIELTNFVLNLFILHWHSVASLLGGVDG